MKLTLAQPAPVLGEKDANLNIIEKTVSESESDLVVFAELFLTGYMIRDNLTKLAEPLSGESVKKVARIASEHGTHIIFGMAEESEEVAGQIYNSSVLVYPEGRVERYRKMHLANFGPFEEHLYFGVGSDLPVFDTKFGRLGMLICFDCFFPELSKIYALKGADLLVAISASPSTTRVYFEKIMLSRAIENTVFFTYTNLVGTELNMVYWGGNTVVGPRGDVKAKGDLFKEDNVHCEIDIRDLVTAREFRPTIRDTRPELFFEIKRLLDETVKGNMTDTKMD